jgi:hypothetical protein
MSLAIFCSDDPPQTTNDSTLCFCHKAFAKVANRSGGHRFDVQPAPGLMMMGGAWD